VDIIWSKIEKQKTSKYAINFILMYVKTSCQNQIKFISDIYLQLYKTLQLFMNLSTVNTGIFTNIKVIESTCTHIYTNTKVIKMPSLLKPGLN
jgi:hypothetical protein